MATYYAKNAGSVLAANAWNTTADGSGTDTTFADGDATGHTLDLNNKAMTSPTGTTLTCTLLQSGATNAGGTLTPTGTLTIAGKVKYTHTSTSGMIIVGTDATLTVTCSLGAGHNAVENTSTGRAIVISGSGALVVSNSGGTALAQTSTATGACVQSNTSGTIDITGALTDAGTGTLLNGVLFVQGSGAVTVTGNVTSSGAVLYDTYGSIGAYGPAVTITGNLRSTNANSRPLSVMAGTVTLDGNISGPGWSVKVVLSGTFVWTGNRTIAASEDCRIYLDGATATCNLRTASAKLTLANSGSFMLIRQNGTLNTADAGAGAASIVNQTATSYAAMSNVTDAQRAIITGASIPSAADTRYGVTRGWADGGTAATAGCGVAGGNGLLEIPNSDAPTGTQDATSDDCVVSGKKYGSPQRTGTAAGGGGGGSCCIIGG